MRFLWQLLQYNLRNNRPERLTLPETRRSRVVIRACFISYVDCIYSSFARDVFAKDSNDNHVKSDAYEMSGVECGIALRGNMDIAEL